VEKDKDAIAGHILPSVKFEHLGLESISGFA
jgi:hypothetical protein